MYMKAVWADPPLADVLLHRGRLNITESHTMVEISPAMQAALASAKPRPEYKNEERPREAFLAELIHMGLKPPRALELNRIMRMAVEGDKGKKKSGWAIYYESGIDRVFATGVYGNWRSGLDRAIWSSHSKNAMEPLEYAQLNADIEAAKIEQARLQEEAHVENASEALEIIESYPQALGSNGYLTRKGVMASKGVKQLVDRLAIPIYGADGKLQSLQYIWNDGKKRFKTGAKKKGGWFKIEGLADTVFIAEGYATAASIHMATQATVYVAFDCGNLYEVAAYVKRTHADATVIIAGDDDTATEGNPGRTKATQAAIALGLGCVFPEGVVDFNDLHAKEGLAWVSAELLKKPKTYKQKQNLADIDQDLLHPCGILGEIVDYYNAHMNMYQPGFAVQTALALGSVLCGRVFTTNQKNRSALFLMNIGESGAGKEDGRTLVRKILGAAGCDNLIAGDGYTSQGAVLSACHIKPRHISMIDEFSHYMRSAANKNGNSNMQDANASLMTAIASPDGTLRAKNYSFMNLPKEKRKELEDMKVLQPSITLLCTSTPDDLFKNITLDSVKDGFYNRFIFFISDTPRMPWGFKEELPVPESILRWIKAINTRRGGWIESPSEEPKLERLVFNAEAITILRELDDYARERTQELKKFSMDRLTVRLFEMAMRISMILALGEDPSAVIIEARHADWACRWVKHNHIVLTKRLKSSISGSDFEARKLESLEAFRQIGEQGVTEREMHIMKPFSKYDKKQRTEVIEALKEATLIDILPRFTGKPGKPPMAWTAIE